jgi:hypothetical protein
LGRGSRSLLRFTVFGSGLGWRIRTWVALGGARGTERDLPDLGLPAPAGLVEHLDELADSISKYRPR